MPPTFLHGRRGHQRHQTLPHPCPASASLPVSQFASWKMMSTGCSRGCWLSSTCLGPAEVQTRASILFWEGAFVTSLPDPASFPLVRNSYSCSGNTRESQQAETAVFASFLLIHQPEPIKLTGAQLFPLSLLISDPVVREDMIKCKIKCLMPGIWDYWGRAGWPEVEGCVWFGEVLGCWCFSTSFLSSVASKGQGSVKPLHIIQPRAVPKGKASLHDAQEWLWEGISVPWGWG